MISSLGIGSGLDIENIITQLLELESEPLVQLQRNRASVETSISGIGQAKSILGDLEAIAERLGNTTLGQSVVSSDSSVFTVEITDPDAQFSNQPVDVIAVPAAQRLQSKVYGSADAIIGQGQLNISLGSESFNIDVTTANQSITQIADSINAASDNPGIKASVSNNNGEYRLQLIASDLQGAASKINVNVIDNDGNASDIQGLSALSFNPGQQSLTEQQSASDFVIRIDGTDYTSADGQFDNVINGVNLQAIAVGEAQLSTDKSVTRSTVKANLEDFAESYNNVTNTFNELRNSALGNDGLLLQAQRRIQDALASSLSTGSSLSYAFELGLTFNKEGVLSVDTERLDTALDTRLSEVVSFLADDRGFGQQITSLLSNYTSTGGLLDNRSERLSLSTSDIDDQIVNMAERLERTETRLRRQYSALDGLLASLQNTSDYVQQQLSSLPTVNDLQRQ